MPKVTIDGQTVEVESGTTVIEAAARLGIEIPHFCWHPKLEPAGNCRMCLVEVEKMPKLAIACMTQVADGMVVHTGSEKAVNARQAVMEFLLINHPLDCPICDEAGECKLQDYAYLYSRGYSRFDEDKVHKPKRVPLGPRVMLDVERCIMCSRCIRFADEIAHQPVFTFTQRGDHVVLATAPGTEFDSPYSMNVIELCPVGALTSRDFRFKSRVWEMSATDGVCTGCSRGCNTNIWVRNNEILRLTPRHNERVNSYWMCDHGRLETFKQVHSGDRLNSPLIRKDDRLVEVNWDEAVAKAVSEIRSFKKTEIAVVGSHYATNEDLFTLSRFAHEVLGVKSVETIAHTRAGFADDFLRTADVTPNSAGARLLGCAVLSDGEAVEQLANRIKKKEIKALYVLDEDVATHPVLGPVTAYLQTIIYQSSWKNKTAEMATVVFSSSTYAEKNGTFTNVQGAVQRIRPAVATMELDRSLDGLAQSRWDKFASHNDSWGPKNKKDARPHWRILAAVSTALGTPMRYKTSEDVFREIAERIPAFRGLSYLSIGPYGAWVSEKHGAQLVPKS